ncbi:MAG: hypothetical protein KGJ32_12850 [Xanthomonadaceae bacterium]|nr:hypothetical protein [Xanthomonadaceae bacterium]
MLSTFVAAVAIRYLRPDEASVAIGGMYLWLGYAGVLGYIGVFGDPALRPPGPAFVLIPVFLFVFLFLARSAPAARIAASIPLGLLMGAQVFRVGVELFLYRLWHAGLAPHMLTFEGANFDILIGLSAPVVAWLHATGRMGERPALAWNGLGIAMLANVAVRAMLTAPGLFHLITTDLPDRAIGIFPFTYIPGFMAPLGLTLHVLAIRALRAKLRMRTAQRPHPRKPQAE